MLNIQSSLSHAIQRVTTHVNSPDQSANMLITANFDIVMALPPEIINTIFAMSKTSLPAIALTCKQWQVIADAPSFYEQIFPPIAKGQADWVELLSVHPGDIPRLPRKVHADIERMGDYQPLITFIPMVIRQINKDGSLGERKSLTKQLMGTLVENPKSGHRTNYHENAWLEVIRDEEDTLTSHWAVIDTHVIGRSREYYEQRSLAQRTGRGAKLPNLRSLIVSVFIDFVKTGNAHSMFAPDSTRILPTWIRVEGKTERLRRCVGFSTAGLDVHHCSDSGCDDIAVVASLEMIKCPLRPFPILLTTIEEGDDSERSDW